MINSFFLCRSSYSSWVINKYYLAHKDAPNAFLYT